MSPEPRGVDARELFVLAVRAQQVGRAGEAEGLYRRLLDRASPTTDAEMLGSAAYNLAVLLRERGALAEAADLGGLAVAYRPNHAKSRNNLGAALEALGRTEEAEASFRRALGLQHDYVNAHYNLANLLRAQGRAEEAVGHYRHALALAPGDADALAGLAMALNALGRADEAFACCAEAVRIQPGHVLALDLMGVLLAARGRSAEAESCHRKAVAIDPGFAQGWSNLGALLSGLDRLLEAEAACRQALAVDPGRAEAHNNLGHVLMLQGATRAAQSCFADAIALKPDYADAHWNQARAMLLRGEFEAGWRDFEWRWRLEGGRAPAFARPAWDGSPGERTILLHAEQGAGDAFQFIRYAQLVKARGAQVIVRAPSALVRVLRRASGVDAVVADHEILPAFVAHAPLMSLPSLLGPRLQDIPSDTPYLTPEPDRLAVWRERLEGGPRPAIGLVWRGNPANSEDRRRSIPAEILASYLSADVRWISLQRGASPGDLAALSRSVPLEDAAPGLDDWAETAALIGALDAVVTVDTAVAHLAGALAKPTAVLLSAAADWRWLEARRDSPWYPRARLFRQETSGDWSGPLELLRREMAEGWLA
jgi:tetratricopeptide (TPR) repeat protein